MDPLIQILILAVLVSLVTNLIRRKLISREDTLKMAESQLYKKSLLEARRRGDEKLIQKLMKRQEYYQKIDAQIAKKNIITLFATLAVFYLAYILLGRVYGNGSVANLPADLIIPFISQGNQLTVAGWFIISLIAAGLPISKILGLGGVHELTKEAEKKIKE
jgi:uncharacterized membrane protein (DUF106 family)